MGGNNSPILLTNVPQPIATFNRPFELSELVGKLVGVMTLYDDSVVTVTCVSYEETGQTKYALAVENDHLARLAVEGNTLLCSITASGSYLFDIDYDEQHKKTWTLNEGQYLLQVPNLLDNDFQQPVFAMINYSPIDNRIEFGVNSLDEDDGYLPMCADAGLQDIDIGAWFNNATGLQGFNEYVAPILRHIIGIEYASVSLSIEGFTGSVAIDGTFNPFTDGDPIE